MSLDLDRPDVLAALVGGEPYSAEQILDSIIGQVPQWAHLVEGERAFCYAQIEIAIRDITTMNARRSSLHLESAVEWIQQGYVGRFRDAHSFDGCCNALGYNADRLREVLLKLAEEKRKFFKRRRRPRRKAVIAPQTGKKQGAGRAEKTRSAPLAPSRTRSRDASGRNPAGGIGQASSK